MKHAFLIRQYLRYLLTAKTAHGIHSPFVFDIVNHLLNAKNSHPSYERIRAMRNNLYQNKSTLQVEDFGAGSLKQASTERRICDIARNAGRNEKFGKLLSSMIRHYDIEHVLELGTSLGLGTSYMAMASDKVKVTSIEGSQQIAATAANNFTSLGLNNITQHVGNFDEVLEPVLQQMLRLDLMFIDGNHREEPTLRYFLQSLPYIHEHSIFIFDDIHWSPGMHQAWTQIQQHDSVTLTIDLFYFGLVFFRKEFSEKQHFTLRF
jgi:predicted O-methyltransferase YrrM